MEAAAWERKYNQLFELARKTRHHWRQFKEFGATADKEKAIYYQRQLDHHLIEEVKRRKTNQQEFF